MDEEDTEQYETYPEREKEEDLGPPFTNLELWQDVNTVESRSEEDDLLESSARLYHRTVTRYQVEFQSTMKKLVAQVSSQTKAYLCKHEQQDKESVVSAAKDFIRKERERLRGFLQQAIEKESEERNKRDTKIRQWVEEKPFTERAQNGDRIVE